MQYNIILLIYHRVIVQYKLTIVVLIEVFLDQQLIRMIKSNHFNAQFQILPNTNWFKKGESLTTDHLIYGDAGFYDLFLHAREFIYSVSELYELMKQAGLNFVEYYKKPRELLRPGNWITDEELIGKINDFDIVRQRHIAEIITGNLVFHEFYVSKMPNSTDTSRHIDEITFPPGKHTSQIDAYRI